MNPAYLRQLFGHRVQLTMIGIHLGPVVPTALTDDGYLEYATSWQIGVDSSNQPMFIKATGKILMSALVGVIDLGEPTLRN